MKLEPKDIIAALEQYKESGYECVLIGQIRIIKNERDEPITNIDNNVVQTITELGLLNKKKLERGNA